MKLGRRVLPTILVVLSLVSGARIEAAPRAVRPAAIQEPVLKWQHGGCYSSWCETGWYSSPAVADLDDDGTMEVIAGAYTVFILNGEDGTEQRSIDTPGGRVWPGVVVADLDGDGDLEIVTAQGSGYLNVLDHVGDSVWTRQPVSNELRGLSVYDLDDDGTKEIVVTAARGSRTNTWVYEHDGSLRAGWPQLDNDSGYAWGVFNDNAAIGDLDDDGMGELVVPSDVHYICAYEPNGVQIPAHAMYGDKAWGRVGVHVDHDVDLRGYAHCGTEHRPNFAHAPANIVDVNGDGVLEVVAMGNVYNCGTNPYTSLYEMPFIFNADRSRWSGDGFDWTVIPIPDGSAAPLSESYSVIENNQPNPVTADLDGDGNLEILFPSYDGRLHAYWLDKTEHHNWPYDVHTGGPYRFASEPVVEHFVNQGTVELVRPVNNGEVAFEIKDEARDIVRYRTAVVSSTNDLGLVAVSVRVLGDGELCAGTASDTYADRCFAIEAENSGGGTVKLWAFDDEMGPIDPGDACVYHHDGNGWVALSGRTSGTDRGYVFATGDTPGFSSFLLGDQNSNPTAVSVTPPFVQPDLTPSYKAVSPAEARHGQTVTYTVAIRNSSGPLSQTVLLTDTVPTGLAYVPGTLAATAGSVDDAAAPTLTWSGVLSPTPVVTVTYVTTVTTSMPQTITNVAVIDVPGYQAITRTAAITVNPFAPGYLCGDVNGDNKVDVVDAFLVAQYDAGLDVLTSFNPMAADVNSDDKVDIVDALMIAQYYVGLPVELTCK